LPISIGVPREMALGVMAADIAANR
jgi:hypothetical protein